MHRVIIGVFVLIAIIAVGAFVSMNYNETPRQNERDKATYVALGDSVTAGIGLPNYSDASACNRTDESYPSVLARENNYALKNLACSAATISSGVDGPQNVNNLSVESQLGRMFADEQTPELITLTIGANDIQWTQFLACYTTECSADLRSALPARYEKLNADLTRLLSKITQRYTTSMPKIVVTGYYQLLPARDVTCEATTGLDNVERELIDEVFNGLNTTLKNTAAKFNSVQFMPIDFDGHELCSKDSWIQSVEAKAPFHPTEAGQAAIAKQLAAVIKSNR